MATPRGTNEVERLADLVGPAVRQGEADLRACVPVVRRLHQRRTRQRGVEPLWWAVPTALAPTMLKSSSPVTRQTACPPGASPMATWPGPPISSSCASSSEPVAGGQAGPGGRLTKANCTRWTATPARRCSRLATDGSQVVAIALLGNTALVATKNGGLFAVQGRLKRRMKPVIALVGRPNVGKSTLFNRLTKSRDAIVADFAGLTRDRHYGDGRLGDREFICIDTGGFEPDSSDRHRQGDGQADQAGRR